MSDPMVSAAHRTPSPRRQALQERVAGAIVVAAANVIASRGGSWSMGDIAAAAGVARATLYRYFPTREALLSRVADVALANAAARVREAQLDRVPVAEGVVRVVRALLDLGDFFTVLAGEHVEIEGDAYEDAVGEPLRALIRRGQDAGEIRSDIPAESLAKALIALVSSMWRSLRPMGRDETVAAASDVFLQGAYSGTSRAAATT